MARRTELSASDTRHCTRSLTKTQYYPVRRKDSSSPGHSEAGIDWWSSLRKIDRNRGWRGRWNGRIAGSDWWGLQWSRLVLFLSFAVELRLIGLVVGGGFWRRRRNWSWNRPARSQSDLLSALTSCCLQATVSVAAGMKRIGEDVSRSHAGQKQFHFQPLNQSRVAADLAAPAGKSCNSLENHTIQNPNYESLSVVST